MGIIGRALIFGRFGLLLALAGLVASCRQTPAAVKQGYLESGDRYAAAKEYREAIIEYKNALKVDAKSGEARLRLGEAYLHVGDPIAARQEFMQAADVLPYSAEGLLKIGGHLLLARQFEDARRVAEKLLAHDPKSVPALVLRANAMAGLEDLDTAIKQIEEAIQLDPEHTELYSNLAAMEAGSGQLRDAEGIYKRAIDLAPNSSEAHASLGSFYWKTNRPADAEEEFHRALELNPKFVLAHRALASFYLAERRPKEAGKHLQAVAELSGSIDARLTLADYYLLTNRKKEGVDVLEQVAKEQAGFVDATTRLAAVAYADGRRPEAHKLIDQALLRNPPSPQALLLKARFLSKEKLIDEALKRAIAAVDAKPSLVDANYLVGQLYYAKGEYEKAATCFKRVLELNPLATAANLQLAQVYLAMGSGDTSLEYADAAVRSAPDNLGARLALVKVLLVRQDLGRAEFELNQILRQYPWSAEAYSLMGTLKFYRKDYLSSRRAYEVAFKSNPDSVETLSGLIGLDLVANRPADARARVDAQVARTPGRTALLLLAARTYGATRDLAKAEELLKKAIELDPSTIDAYGMLGQLYYDQGKLASGQKEFEVLVARDPRSIAGYTMLAILLKKQGQVDQAIERYRQALAIDPKAAVAANNLAWIYAEQGRNLDEARLLAITAKKQLPNVAEVADTLGWLYHKSGLRSLAIPNLKESVDKDPKNPLYRYHLGAAYARSGDAVKAKTHLEEALRIQPDFNGSAEARRILNSLSR